MIVMVKSSSLLLVWNFAIGIREFEGVIAKRKKKKLKKRRRYKKMWYVGL